MSSRSSTPTGVQDDAHSSGDPSSIRAKATLRRVSSLLVAFLLLSSVYFSTVVVATNLSDSTAQPPVDGGARIFVASDSDPEVIGSPGGGRDGVLLHYAVDTEASPTNLSHAVDTYTLTTNPETQVRIDGTSHTLQEYRLAQLASVERTNSESRWPASAPDRKNSPFIKDGFIAYMGATSAAKVTVPGAQENGIYLMGTSGRVLNYVDYRVELPEPKTNTRYVRRTKEVTLTIPEPEDNSSDDVQTVTKTVSFRTLDGHTITRTVSATGRGPKTVDRSVTVVVGGYRTYTTYGLASQRVERNLSIGEQTWSKHTTPKTATQNARHIDYADAPPLDGQQQRLQLEATINVTARVTTDHYFYHPLNDTWSYTHTEIEPSYDELTVTDDRPVHVVSPDSVSISQRVIEEPYSGHTVVLFIDGPEHLSERALWGWATFATDSEAGTSPQRLANVWQVYSVRQYYWGETTSNENIEPQRTDFPPTLELRLTARQPSPDVMVVGERDTYRIGDVTNVSQDTVPGVSKPASLEGGVNLTTATANQTSMVVIEDAPGQITSVTSIFGEQMPISTTHVAERKASSLSYTTVSPEGSNENDPAELRLRLTGPDGDLLSNRTIILTGATDSSVTTNANGIAYATFDSATITARFPGDSHTEDRDVYYDSSHETAVSLRNGNLITDLWTFFLRPEQAALLSLAVSVGLLVGVVWYTTR
jgi:hypothetical protein